jgi:hypothetical protein
VGEESLKESLLLLCCAKNTTINDKMINKKVKRICGALAIAYGIHMFGTLGLGIYCEEKLKNSPVWTDYRQEITRVQQKESDCYEKLFRLNDAKINLERAINYADHQNGVGGTLLESGKFNEYYILEKQRLKIELDNQIQAREEARNKLSNNPSLQKYLKHLNGVITRSVVPFHKFPSPPDYFSVFQFEKEEANRQRMNAKLLMEKSK